MQNTNIIYRYAHETAINDGLLIKVGNINGISIVFTNGLFHLNGFKDEGKRAALIERGLALLRQDDPEDTEFDRLRVIEKDKIWVILNSEGITFLRPEDY